MPAISNNIAYWLSINGVGELAPINASAPDTATLFVEIQPDEPDANVTVIETPGVGPEYVMESLSPAFRNPAIQVRVRGETDDHQNVRAKAEEVREVIERISNQTIENGIDGTLTNFLRVQQLGSGINDLGEDSRRRRTYTMNFICKVSDC